MTNAKHEKLNFTVHIRAARPGTHQIHDTIENARERLHDNAAEFVRNKDILSIALAVNDINDKRIAFFCLRRDKDYSWSVNAVRSGRDIGFMGDGYNLSSLIGMTATAVAATDLVDDERRTAVQTTIRQDADKGIRELVNRVLILAEQENARRRSES